MLVLRCMIACKEDDKPNGKGSENQNTEILKSWNHPASMDAFSATSTDNDSAHRVARSSEVQRSLRPKLRPKCPQSVIFSPTSDTQ